MTTNQAPLTRNMSTQAIPVATAGNDDTTVIGAAPFAGTVTDVEYIPKSAITGAATNNRTVAVVNKAQDGTGSTSVASLNFGNAINAAACAEKAITLSGTPANLVVAKGDVLAFTSTHIGTGITDPGGLIRVTIARS